MYTLIYINNICSEAIAAWQLCWDSGWGVVVSHGAGETEDKGPHRETPPPEIIFGFN